MRWGFVPFGRYFEFSGRSRRKEYWWFTLLVGPLAVFLAFIATASFGQVVVPESQLRAILPVLVLIALALPYMSVNVRRLHDIDRSGWWLLLSIIPFGGLLLLYFHVKPGTRGLNRFGPDPLESDHLSEVFA